MGRDENVFYVRNEAHCPHCLGKAKHKRTVDTDYGDVEIYICEDCGKHLRD